MSETKEIVLSKEESKAIELSTSRITTPNEMSFAVSLLSILNRKLDSLTEDKEMITKPLNEALRKIRSKYKPYEEQLENAIALIRKNMSSYQTEQKKIAEAQEDRIIARVGEGKGKLKPETAIAKMQDIDRPDNKISTEEGQVKFKTVKVFKIVDISKIPLEYMLPNEKMIREAMGKGVEIDGCEYSTEEIPVNSR